MGIGYKTQPVQKKRKEKGRQEKARKQQNNKLQGVCSIANTQG